MRLTQCNNIHYFNMTVDFILSSDGITSMLGDIENRAYLDRMSWEISNLDSSSDFMPFLQ